MSKSKGNAVDPFDALQTYGADAIRWYFYTSSAPWLPNRFHGKAVVEGQRKFMSTLWNTYAFFVLYANIDKLTHRNIRWTMRSLPSWTNGCSPVWTSTVKAVDDNLANYRIPEAARALDDFVDDMSNWYVRRSRERFWAKGMEQDKINAYMTLYTALVTVAKAAAPMIPFMTEDIYQNLVRALMQALRRVSISAITRRYMRLDRRRAWKRIWQSSSRWSLWDVPQKYRQHQKPSADRNHVREERVPAFRILQRDHRGRAECQRS